MYSYYYEVHVCLMSLSVLPYNNVNYGGVNKQAHSWKAYTTGLRATFLFQISKNTIFQQPKGKLSCMDILVKTQTLGCFTGLILALLHTFLVDQQISLSVLQATLQQKSSVVSISLYTPLEIDTIMQYRELPADVYNKSKSQ